MRLHVVDLDGALGGAPNNAGAVERLLKNIRMPVEMGGGIRDLKTVALYLEMGISWVILGTKACLDRGFMEEALKEFKDKVIIGIDALKGRVVTDGWTKQTGFQAADLAKEAQRLGAKTVIYTDIAKDGLMQGPNLSEIKAMAKSVELNVIASGGISSLKDLSDLAALDLKNLLGVVIGKALYEKKLSLKEAVKLLTESKGSE